MPGAIVLTGFAANDPVPGSYLEINFAQGVAAGDSSPLEILLICNKTTAGDAAVGTTVYGPDTIVPIQTETDVVARSGAGSEGHRMWRRVTDVNKDTTVRMVFVAESIGAPATGTITFTNNATSNGNARIWVHDEFVDVPFNTGDMPTAVAAAAVIQINNMAHWGVIASNLAGVVTITAKQKGLRGNFIRYMAIILTGTGTTVTPNTDTAMSGGTTADSNATVLGTILAFRYYDIVSAAEDATQLGALVSQVNTQAAPTTGIRQRVFGASVDTLANATTIATGRNSARCEITWQEGSDWTPSELAANAAAVYSLFETKPNPKTNYCGFGNDAVTQAFWKVPAPRDATKAPSRSSIKSALNNGLTPIGVNPNGTTYLVDRITTRSLNGSQNDYRIRDAHKVTICDFFGDDLLVIVNQKHGGKRIADNPQPGQRVPGPLVVWPDLLKATILRLIEDYDSNDLLQDIDKIKADTIVQRETLPTTRLAARIPLRPIDNAKQFAFAVDQVA